MDMLWRNTKRGFLALTLIVGPMLGLYEFARFLREKLDAGHWEWFVIVLAVGIGVSMVVDVANGRYGPWRKRPHQIQLPGRDWQDAPSLLD